MNEFIEKYNVNMNKFTKIVEESRFLSKLDVKSAKSATSSEHLAPARSATTSHFCKASSLFSLSVLRRLPTPEVRGRGRHCIWRLGGVSDSPSLEGLGGGRWARRRPQPVCITTRPDEPQKTRAGSRESTSREG